MACWLVRASNSCLDESSCSPYPQTAQPAEMSTTSTLGFECRYCLFARDPSQPPALDLLENLFGRRWQGPSLEVVGGGVVAEVVDGLGAAVEDGGVVGGDGGGA